MQAPSFPLYLFFSKLYTINHLHLLNDVMLSDALLHKRCALYSSRPESVRSKSPLTASPASPSSFHGSFHSSLGSDGMSCSSARSSTGSPDSARYSARYSTSSQVMNSIGFFHFCHLQKNLFSSSYVVHLLTNAVESRRRQFF